MKALTYIEIDVPDFAGSSPEEIVTFRFAEPTDYLPANIDAIASVTGVGYTPSRISLGQNLGERATLTVSLSDHRHIFGGEPFDQGTFWGKWRARYGQRLRGRSVRWIQGLLGQSLAEMEIRHFVVESTDGPNTDGTYQIIAKDVLKLADDDRAQAPLLSSGFLVANIDADDTSITMNPSGIGDAEYPASGFVAVGGEEICSFTRSGDVLTITRAQFGTVAVAHEAGDRAQLCLRYVNADPAGIISDLLENYAGVPEEYINTAAWLTETAAYLQRLYSAVIPEPTAVKTLISELVEQAALAVWWEPLDQQIRLQVLRAIATTAAIYDDGNTLEGSLKIKDQPGTRISQVWTYFGQRNPLRPVDEEDNYRSVALSADLEAETAYGTPAIKKIFSRWIPFGGRQVALRLNDIQLGRFRDPPRKFTFDLFRYGPENPQLGGGYRVENTFLQDVAGLPVNAPIQVTRLNPMQDRYQIEAEEMLFAGIDQVDLVNRVIIIDSSINNINLRQIHDSIYPAPTVGDSPEITLTVYIETNVIVGSTSNVTFALEVGDWPSGFPITIVLRGRIQGRGGDGGSGSGSNLNGRPGGPAMFTAVPIDLILNDGAGQIWGGGGGGAGRDGTFDGGGGGGAGQLPGLGGIDDDGNGQNGTTEAGGIGAGPGFAGKGGDPGQPGTSAPGGTTGPGGAAGLAILGISFVTKTGAGDIRGAQID